MGRWHSKALTTNQKKAEGLTTKAEAAAKAKAEGEAATVEAEKEKAEAEADAKAEDEAEWFGRGKAKSWFSKQKKKIFGSGKEEEEEDDWANETYALFWSKGTHGLSHLVKKGRRDVTLDEQKEDFQYNNTYSHVVDN